LDLAAQRVRDEVIELASGDRVTGEIKGLDRSYLTVRTIDVGTVQIRWQRVVRLNSNRMLEFVLADGRRLEGSAVSPAARTLEVITGGPGGTVNVGLASIVVIRPVARSWIGKLTGSIDGGFNYTRGSDVAQSSVNAEVISRSPAYEGTLTLNAVLTWWKRSRIALNISWATETFASLQSGSSSEVLPTCKAIGIWALRSAGPSALGWVIS
jgi:hypothetical protein